MTLFLPFINYFFTILTTLISGSQSQERGEIFDFSLRLSPPKLHDNLQLFSVTNNNQYFVKIAILGLLH